MKMPAELVTGTLERRYKRFLADVVLEDGSRITVHCPNTGAMTGCDTPGSRVWLSRSHRPGRKYPYTWELVETPDGVVIGINTNRANRIVQEALLEGRVPELAGYGSVRREVRHGDNCRFDFRLEQGAGPDCLVEVKSVTLADERGQGLFPDARSARGARHLRELMNARATGLRAVNLFCAQRADVNEVRPADDIDPDYGSALRRAADEGVELLACVCELSPQEIRIRHTIPVVLP